MNDTVADNPDFDAENDEANLTNSWMLESLSLGTRQFCLHETVSRIGEFFLIRGWIKNVSRGVSFRNDPPSQLTSFPRLAPRRSGFSTCLS